MQGLARNLWASANPRSTWSLPFQYWRADQPQRLQLCRYRDAMSRGQGATAEPVLLPPAPSISKPSALNTLGLSLLVPAPWLLGNDLHLHQRKMQQAWLFLCKTQADAHDIAQSMKIWDKDEIQASPFADCSCSAGPCNVLVSHPAELCPHGAHLTTGCLSPHWACSPVVGC